jgi:hypothetical protein
MTDKNPMLGIVYPEGVTPQPGDAGQPVQQRSVMKQVLRGAKTSVLVVVNAIALLALGFLVLFVVSESLSPSPTGILILALAPMVAVAVVVASVIDVIFLVKYLFSHQPKSRGRRIAASAGLGLTLGMLGLVGVMFYSNVHGVQQFNADSNKEKGGEFQQLKDRAEAAGDGFDILVPKYLPAGYEWSYGQVANDGDHNIYLDTRYRSEKASMDFDLIIYSKRSSYSPPINCGYYYSPFDQAHPDMKYPCDLVGKTASGQPVYHYEIPARSQTEKPDDAYYTVSGRNVAVLSVLKQNDILKILDSMAPASMNQLVKNNTKSGI